MGHVQNPPSQFQSKVVGFDRMDFDNIPLFILDARFKIFHKYI